MCPECIKKAITHAEENNRAVQQRIDDGLPMYTKEGVYGFVGPVGTYDHCEHQDSLSEVSEGDALSHTELQTFDGLDNRKEVLILLDKLGSDKRRAAFIESLIPSSLKGFAGCPMKVTGPCNTIAAYFMLVGTCNELGVSINTAAKRLEKEVAHS